MERRIDEFRQHCGPHPCEHEDAADSPMTWRYAVIGRDFAYSLTVCKSSGEFALHRAFLREGEEFKARHCDLLGGHGCVYATDYVTNGPKVPVTMPEGLLFWSRFAVQGQRDQPPKFWRELERRAHAEAKEAKAQRYHTTRCPRCTGSGMIVVKPRKSIKVETA